MTERAVYGWTWPNALTGVQSPMIAVHNVAVYGDYTRVAVVPCAPGEVVVVLTRKDAVQCAVMIERYAGSYRDVAIVEGEMKMAGIFRAALTEEPAA